MCVPVSGASHAARRCAKVEISPHALYVCNEAAASRSIADATYCVLRDGLAWQLQCSVLSEIRNIIMSRLSSRARASCSATLVASPSYIGHFCGPESSTVSYPLGPPSYRSKLPAEARSLALESSLSTSEEFSTASARTPLMGILTSQAAHQQSWACQVHLAGLLRVGQYLMITSIEIA